MADIFGMSASDDQVRMDEKVNFIDVKLSLNSREWSEGTSVPLMEIWIWLQSRLVTSLILIHHLDPNRSARTNLTTSSPSTPGGHGQGNEADQKIPKEPPQAGH